MLLYINGAHKVCGTLNISNLKSGIQVILIDIDCVEHSKFSLKQLEDWFLNRQLTVVKVGIGAKYDQPLVTLES